MNGNATYDDISSVKHSCFPDVNHSDNTTTTSNIVNKSNLVVTMAEPNVRLVLATVNLTVNLNCKLCCSHNPVYFAVWTMHFLMTSKRPTNASLNVLMLNP
jgi:hypothetical protein